MEGKYLVISKEDAASPNISVYGTVNPSFENAKRKADNSRFTLKEDNSSNTIVPVAAVEASCPCPDEKDCSEIDCSQMKIILVPWERYKTIAMAVGLSVFGVWIILISIIARQGKL